MTAVFDAHAHCFPPLSEDTGDMAARLAETQHHIRFAGATDIRRTRDDAPVGEPVLVGDGDGISWLPDVNFRIGRYGRVEFTHNGEDYYYQLFTPSLWDNSCPADYMIVQMDYAGVDRALLQSDRMYGRLDDYLADCIRRYPDRLVALAQVDEWRGGSPEQVERVRRQIEEYGFSGLYFGTSGFFHCDFEFGVNDPGLEPLWELIGELGVPIHWSSASKRSPQMEVYLSEIEDFDRWAKAHPDIPSVLTHGLENLRIDVNAPNRYHVPPQILRLLNNPGWSIELMLHKMSFDDEFPPYTPGIKEVVRTLVSELGAEKLVWGSDMPSCEEVVTYKQSMILFKTRCDFLTRDERDGILGGNLERLYPL